MIDGEHRATWKSCVVWRGYEIYDVDHRPIDPGFHKSLGFSVDNKAAFERETRRLLNEGKIPDHSAYERLRAEESEKRRKAALESAEKARLERLRDAAVDMYEALEQTLQYMRSVEPCASKELITTIKAVLTKANGASE